ncbi:hypothetical protein LOZ57_000372 [Ophidiomyces ophidiicola]|uniref:uncharacterized protein n=1 Tax=Ophidiomyces ophidiicola TaxID=1387563 RepID=UPI0020C3E839|nr:uncharacterized protein LOZ57_000372 [Ophidiomyces ophidiicola]KAI1954028.1 hypothetical protein LOZ57_000372 [Ophidiomyces ophidiicola]KAI2047049.1 hypothetical protein LOZ43_005721 [Ophidiomyces ophidiicola]
MSPRHIRHESRRHTLLSIKPLNSAATAVLKSHHNRRLVSMLPNGGAVLNIGFENYSKNSNTLATFGSDNADILVERRDISPTQCSFKVNWDTGVIMLRDHSVDQSTHVFGRDSIPFRSGSSRQIAVIHGLNSKIGLGGEAPGAVQFEMLWHDYAAETIAKVLARGLRVGHAPRHVDIPSTNQGDRRRRIRHVKIGALGAGACGQVFKAIDVDTGRMMAVKQAGDKSKMEPQLWRFQYDLLLREAKALATLEHPHVIPFIRSRIWPEKIEMFVELQQGSVEALMSKRQISTLDICDRLLPQILSALDYLAYQNLIHRDVKPANILYSIQSNGRYHFYLADFGLIDNFGTTSNIGTRVYFAPEIVLGMPQTDRVDVWALFMTMMWVMDVHGFRHLEPRLRSPVEAQQLVEMAKMDPVLSRIQEMAAFDPSCRASAAQMLVRLFCGKGLTTPIHKVI